MAEGTSAMEVYLITYDLGDGGQEDPRLAADLACWGARRLLTLVWAVQTDLGAGWIRGRMREHIELEGSILVVRLDGEAAWQRVESEARLQENLGAL